MKRGHDGDYHGAKSEVSSAHLSWQNDHPGAARRVGIDRLAWVTNIAYRCVTITSPRRCPPTATLPPPYVPHQARGGAVPVDEDVRAAQNLCPQAATFSGLR
jgi:hypothetical protein